MKYLYILYINVIILHNAMAELDLYTESYDILLESSTHASEDLIAEPVSMDTFTAFKFNDKQPITLPISKLSLSEVTLFRPYIINSIFKFDETPDDSCLFSIVDNKGDAILELGFTPAGEDITRISLDGERVQENNKSASFIYYNSLTQWTKLLIHVELEQITFYVNCEENERKELNAETRHIDFPKNSQLFLGHSGKGNDFFRGIVQEIKIYPGADKAKQLQICTDVPILPASTGSDYTDDDKTIAENLERFMETNVTVQGEKGEKGDKGVKGEQGPAGVGPQGPQGPKGSPGSPGTKGENGTCACSETVVSSLLKSMPEMRGPPGLVGPRGYGGDTGSPGLTGKQGNQGERGPPGLKGDRGYDGTPGNNGAPAAKGEPGKDGEPGTQGPQGLIGPPGPPGPPGSNYKETETATALVVPGERGAQGPIGPPGSPGIKGLQGEKGETGDYGEKGDQGHMGPEGSRGEKGERGESGRDGLPGEPGTHGRPAEKGDKGDSGDMGPQGLPGRSVQLSELLDPKNTEVVERLRGVKGEIGRDGEKGDKGDLGLTGPPGLSGRDGRNGSTGEKGQQGTKGEPGPIGHIGHKGEPGEPGLPGNGSAVGVNLVKGPKGDKGERGAQGIRGPIGKPGSMGGIGQSGPKGNIGNPGPKGPIGDRGEKGDAAEKGEKGECASPAVLEKLKGPKGDQGTPGIQGPPGPPGTGGYIPVAGPPGPPGPAGPPGPPGLTTAEPNRGTRNTFSQSTYYSYFETDPEDEDDEFSAAMYVVYRTTAALSKKTPTTRLGTLAYVLQEKILLIRVEDGWRNIMMGSLKYYAAPTPYSITMPISTPARLVSSTSPRSITSRHTHAIQPFIRLAALNEPHAGNFKTALATPEADHACYRQALRHNHRGNFVGFFNTKYGLNNLVRIPYMDLPVKNLRGELLFKSWNSIFNGSGANFEGNIYSFEGKNVFIDPVWNPTAIWHGYNLSGRKELEAICDQWQSDKPKDFGYASILNKIGSSNLLEQRRFPCDSKLIVLCVEISPQNDFQRRRRHSPSRRKNRLMQMKQERSK